MAALPSVAAIEPIAEIVSTRTMSAYVTSNYTEYAVAVYDHDGRYLTFAWRRYNVFKKLHKKLRQQLKLQNGKIRNGTESSAQRLPSLPPGTRGKNHPTVVAQRRDQLKTYLNGLLRLTRASPTRPPVLSGPICSAALDQFLGLDRAAAPLPKLPSLPSDGFDAGFNISKLQEAVAECEELEDELADELQAAGLPMQTVTGVCDRAGQLVQAVQELAAEQEESWRRALLAEEARARSLESTVTLLAVEQQTARHRGTSAGSASETNFAQNYDHVHLRDNSGASNSLSIDPVELDPIDGVDYSALLFGSDDEGEESTGDMTASVAIGQPSEDMVEGESDDDDDDDALFFDVSSSDSRERNNEFTHGGLWPSRTRLASYKAFGAVSMWTFLKEAIGMDLTRITFPVAFNEPITLLQRMTEDLEYSHLLDRASRAATADQRLLYVAAFAMSNYTATAGRLGKPFNPLLHETFEFHRPHQQNCEPRVQPAANHDEQGHQNSNTSSGEGGFRSLAEQVGHHPPVSAICAEGLPHSPTHPPPWRFSSDWTPKIKFYGASADVKAEGLSRVELNLQDQAGVIEHYCWEKTQTRVMNIIVGTMGICHHGLLRVVCKETGKACELTFHKQSFFDSGPDPRRITGVLRGPGPNGEMGEGAVTYHLQGSWDDQNGHLNASATADADQTAMAVHSTQEPEPESGDPSAAVALLDLTLFVVTSRPPDSTRQFEFTTFAVTLNDPGRASQDSSYASSDSILRPDVRAMENGDLRVAADEKHRLEAAQRARRKEREAQMGNTSEPPPRWFVRARGRSNSRHENNLDVPKSSKKALPPKATATWEFTGEYWKAKADGSLDCAKIF